MLILLVVATQLYAADANPTRPNIVVFLVDDMGVMDTESQNVAASRTDQLRVMMQRLIASLDKHNALYPVDNKGGTAPLKPRLP